MASPMSRTICRTVRGRLYSAQAAMKADGQAPVKSDVPRIETVNGIKVATLENNSPLSRVVVMAQAGSRFENPGNLGITHCIRHASELSNEQKSSFRLIKDLQFQAGCFSASTTRDYAIYSMDCIRANAEQVMPLLGPMVTRTAIHGPNWRDYAGLKPRIQFDLACLNEQPNIKVIELLHSAAYRNTLGNSIYCPSSFLGSHTMDQVVEFMQNHYAANRVALVGSGVDHDLLVSMARNMTFSKGGSPNTAAATYYGGEVREDRPDLEYTYVAVATQGPSLSSKDLLVAGVLQEIMGAGCSIKYGESASASKLSQAVSKVTNDFSVNGFNANYTDSGLFGFVVAAQPGDMGKVLKAAFSEFAALTKGGLTDADVARGKNQLKSSILMANECSQTQLTGLAEQLLGSSQIKSAANIVSMVDAITTADVTAVAKKLVNGKPSMGAIGNLASTPFIEDLLK